MAGTSPAMTRSVGGLLAWIIQLTMIFALCAVAVDAARAQGALSAEEERTIEFGKEVYKNKANCQYCHKWDATGDTGYGGIALSLRKSQLTPEQFAEVVRCGRPFTGMPYHDRMAYTDKRCFGMTRDDLGKDAPPMGEFLQPREVDAVVKYLYARAVGHGETTYEDCVDFWGRETRQCDPLKK
jgi:mono/diheme cytochrome c family protein